MVASLVILGSTGSIGRQTLSVARHLGLRVTALAAGKNVEEMLKAAVEFSPRFCAMGDENAAAELRQELFVRGKSIPVYAGTDGICEMLAAIPHGECDLVLNAIVGMAGLLPTLAALENGFPLALANKESLVCGGERVMALAKEKGLPILPVDSEHSAIFQCLQAGKRSELRRILLTASGGPFFGKRKEDLADMTAARALAHPTWKMGAKITVDSATMMNKGFEVIEAVHLFGVSPRLIEVVVHRESIIHSMVEFADRTVIAQMANPDMRDCIQYAITYPDRLESEVEPLDLPRIGALTFFRPDEETFPLLPFAVETVEKGGILPSTLNGANEAAVAAFLAGEIPFGRIAPLVTEVTREAEARQIPRPTVAQILQAGEDAMASVRARI